MFVPNQRKKVKFNSKIQEAYINELPEELVKDSKHHMASRSSATRPVRVASSILKGSYKTTAYVAPRSVSLKQGATIVTSPEEALCAKPERIRGVIKEVADVKTPRVGFRARLLRYDPFQAEEISYASYKGLRTMHKPIFDTTNWEPSTKRSQLSLRELRAENNTLDGRIHDAEKTAVLKNSGALHGNRNARKDYAQLVNTPSQGCVIL